MNFDDTPEEAAFRAEVRAWIDANAPKELRPTWRPPASPPDDWTGVDAMAAAKAWQKKKAEAGWACLHWPKEYGGRGGDADRAGDLGPGGGPYGALGGIFIIGLGMCVPTMMAFASEEQKRRFLPPLAARRGDLVPAVLRAGRRLRSRGPAHPRRAGRRRLRRLDHQRPEDLDLAAPSIPTTAS